MFCKKCGKEIMDEAVVCIHCGCSTQDKSVVNTQADAPSKGMAVLGFFIPLVGFIIWLVNKKDKPLMAKSARKGAVIGLIVAFLVFACFCATLVPSINGINAARMY